MKIALLSALPHSEEEIAQAQGNLHKDYIRNNLGGFKDLPEVIWADMRTSLSCEAKRLFALCNELDVSVTRSAGLDQLTAAAAKFDVVIVLAHWKGPYISLVPPDLIVPPSDLLTSIKQCEQLEILSPQDRTLVLNSPTESKALDNLANVLNEAMERWEEWVKLNDLPNADVDYVFVSRAYGLNHARSILNQIFGSNRLIPGARIELDDGLWTPYHIADCFGNDWGGICDFVCCTSEYLAEETKARHPRALFRADSRLLYPEKILPAVYELLQRLTSELISYRSLTESYISIMIDCDRKFGG